MAVEDTTFPLWQRVTMRIEGDVALSRQVVQQLYTRNESTLRRTARAILLSYTGDSTPEQVDQLVLEVKSRKGW